MASRQRDGLIEGALTESVIASFFAVYRELGFGYRERIYALALERELIARGHRVGRDVAAVIYYRGEPLARQNLDMVVDERIVVENKSTERLHPGSSTAPDIASASSRAASRSSRALVAPTLQLPVRNLVRGWPSLTLRSRAQILSRGL